MYQIICDTCCSNYTYASNTKHFLQLNKQANVVFNKQRAMMRAKLKGKDMCSFDVVVNLTKLEASYSEYRAGLDVGGYFWIEQQILDSDGFGFGMKHCFE